MTGAAAMAGQSALRSGAGLATVATFSHCLGQVASFSPCYTTLPLPTDHGGDLSPDAADVLFGCGADAIACGPGLGNSQGARRVTSRLFRQATCPLVIDADGLNNLSLDREPLSPAAGPRLLTPHPGEFRRLVEAVGWPPAADRSQQRRQAVRLAAEHDLIVVLKGHRTLITDGKEEFENTSGNPGMATAGSGDVLTGVIVALIGQKLSPLEAARLGVYVHGLAGDLAAEQKGQIGMIATDLIDALPAAMLELSKRPGGAP